MIIQLKMRDYSRDRSLKVVKIREVRIDYRTDCE